MKITTQAVRFILLATLIGMTAACGDNNVDAAKSSNSADVEKSDISTDAAQTNNSTDAAKSEEEAHGHSHD